MRLACVTPFYRDNSVGDVAERVTLEIQRAGHDVFLVGTGRPPYRETNLNHIMVGEYAHIDAELLYGCDAVIYNPGNHDSSAPIYEVMERVPGIVVLHDRMYAHGYAAYTNRFGRLRFVEKAIQVYGREGGEFAWRFLAGGATSEEMHRFSFIDVLLENATGVIAHYEEFGTQIRAITEVPVVSSFRPGYPIVKNPDHSFRRGAEFFLVYVGCITPHRCLSLLFSVLAGRPDLLVRTRLAIVGLVDDPLFARHLQDLAVTLGIAEAIEWAFDATDELKHTLLSTADAAFNCRSLNAEGLSGSLMEQMMHGLPVIVNANGFALEAPADAVSFVDQTDMRRGIEQAIDALLEDSEHRRAVGARARAWAEANGSTKGYAKAIIQLAESVSRRNIVGRVKGRVSGLFRDILMDDVAIKADIEAVIEHLLDGASLLGSEVIRGIGT